MKKPLKIYWLLYVLSVGSTVRLIHTQFLWQVHGILYDLFAVKIAYTLQSHGVIHFQFVFITKENCLIKSKDLEIICFSASIIYNRSINNL